MYQLVLIMNKSTNLSKKCISSNGILRIYNSSNSTIILLSNNVL